MRKKDLANEQKASRMKSIFGGLGGTSDQATGKGFEPTYETCSSDEEKDAGAKKNNELEGNCDNMPQQIPYEAAEEGEESYYDEEEDNNGGGEAVLPNGRNLEDVEYTEEAEK